MQNHQILFVQGAGEGAHAEDQALATYLTHAVAPDCTVRYPRFAGLEDVAYEVWKTEIAAELRSFGKPGIVVAHSLGGAAMLKYLSEQRPELSLAGLFLVGTPYKCVDGEWGSDDFAMPVDFASALPRIGAIFLYHSADDEWVPFPHLARWAEKLPAATVRPFTDRGHSFSKLAFPELIADIRSLRQGS
ncbi:putative alpha/beta hydrolase family esterase [Pelomonas saccharophila]|uniref:Alpha/beta hydrolase family esterase n=1 Tax=Roseateles saccharophilus TaxID=304 RepID=A0ABU1YWL0_ROSSA|nr:alpha/beta fold hydrolase [Roseateles saccharophilus]MDR7272646.1 putative alpha/beta hydrolase family esterase [Roseateles saccharophilus]